MSAYFTDGRDLFELVVSEEDGPSLVIRNVLNDEERVVDAAVFARDFLLVRRITETA